MKGNSNWNGCCYILVYRNYLLCLTFEDEKDTYFLLCYHQIIKYMYGKMHTSIG